jgi:hypothetical protein
MIATLVPRSHTARGAVLAFCAGRKTSARNDGGTTWKAGGLVPADVKGLNECTVAELPGFLARSIQ